MITVTYTSLDHVEKSKTYKTLKGAQTFAQKMVGTRPELGTFYAVSFDGIGKVTVDGASLYDLFPESPAAVDSAREAEMLAAMEAEDMAREAYLRGDLDEPEPKPRPKYSFDSVEEAEEAYYEALECWHERYAEAGSSWVFGGGNPYDANLAASEGAGPKPRREDFGLPSEPKPVPATEPDPRLEPDDDDIPF